jgi:uncharacterized protein
MIIDVHVHYGYLFFPIKLFGVPDLIKKMDVFGLDISIISNLRGIFHDFRDCNRELYEAISGYPDRLKGYIVVNPNYPEESLRQIEEYSKIKQFIGVKLHASWHNQPIDNKKFDVIFEKCEELDLPVLVHSYVADDSADQVSCPERIANVAMRHKNPIIIAHMGGNSKRTARAVKDIGNVYIDISSGRERATQLYVWKLGRVDDAVRELGAERVLFGSDFPLLDPSICMGMMEDSKISGREKELVMYKNAKRIFDI